MRTRILDKGALTAISPLALAAYARGGGWTKTEPYGDRADIYVGDGCPEIVLPRTDRLTDYASVVSRLIGIFGEVAEQDELAVYRDLVDSEHDVVRVRAVRTEDDGSIALDEGVELVSQSREMLLAAACATKVQRPVYRAGANLDATEYMKRVRLGQTEHGSFVVTLIAPVPPTLQSMLDESWARFDDEPYERQVTRRLVQALEASRDAAEGAHSGDGATAFKQAVTKGVSANLCDAVATLIELSSGLEVSVSWAKTRPTPESRRRIRFSESDAGVLKEAARTFRAREPRPDVELFGNVHRLVRGPTAAKGQVAFTVIQDEKPLSVSATLGEEDYSIAISAHEARNPVIVRGDLKQIGHRWHVTNATVQELVSDEEDEDDPPSAPSPPQANEDLM